MTRVHLVILWHMHQPQYRDPATGRYVLPWTRLHALKDYWGMVHMLTEFPRIHANFNIVPSLAHQIDEYASGNFHEDWFDVAFKPAVELTPADKQEILTRAFQVNHEHLMSRWPRFVELFAWAGNSGIARAIAHFSLRDWRDLQLLSQLAWFDEEYLASDPVITCLSAQGSGYSEEDKQVLRAKHAELLSRVLPAYRAAAERGQVELSTTPFYHPILPLLCDSDIARVANPYTPPLAPPFRHPEDARRQLTLARESHERFFGNSPVGLWPSEGSVSDEVLKMAAEMGFRWFATDEGILGRTRNIGFWRDSSGYPENAGQLYSPWRFRIGGQEISGIFRDHYLSDLIGFVYSRMDASAAADDFHRRIRAAGERSSGAAPVLVPVILDGENAWEYYPGNGREFLRQLYRRIEQDPDIQALTVSEAIAASAEIPSLESIFPGSWINANFDIWIGDPEDIRAWELLRDAREAFEKAEASAKAPAAGASPPDFSHALDSLLAAEGSDWCWWFGPEHGSVNDAEFDSLYRKLLAEIYASLGLEVPEALAHPIKHLVVKAKVVPASDWLNVKVDGRVSSYFEWLGAGTYATERRSGAMHSQAYYIADFFFGFSADRLFLRVDLFPEVIERLQEYEIRIQLRDAYEWKVTLAVHGARLIATRAERDGREVPADASKISAALGKILEVSLAKELFSLPSQNLEVSISLWRGGMPVDLLPGEGSVEIPLGEENFAWAAN